MSLFARFKNWLTPPPAKSHLDLGLGHFQSDDDVWTTEVRHGSGNFRLSLAGSDSEPDARLLKAALALITTFDDLRQTALDFLASEEAQAPIKELRCSGLDLLWLDQPGDFTLEFVLPDDEEDIWRVQFLSGIPKYVGHDS